MTQEQNMHKRLTSLQGFVHWVAEHGCDIPKDVELASYADEEPVPHITCKFFYDEGDRVFASTFTITEQDMLQARSVSVATEIIRLRVKDALARLVEAVQCGARS
jgi:hypothetical protein